MITNTSLFWVLAAQMIGVLSYFSLETEPSIFATSILVTTCTTILLRTIVKKSGNIFLFILLLSVIVGFGTAKFKTEISSSDKLSNEVYVHNIKAYIQNIENLDNGLRITVYTTNENKKLSLISKIKNQSELNPGDVIKFSGKLYPPKAPASEYSYDQLRNAYFNKVFAFGIITAKITVYENLHVSNLLITVNKLRIYLYKKMFADLPPEKASIAAAILIGSKHSIKRETTEQIRLVGISHLFAISGMHLNAIAGIIIFTICSILSIFQSISLKYNTQKLASVIAIPLIFFYLILSGLQTSTQRAFIMLSLALVSNIAYKSYSAERSIIITLMFILLLEPEELLNPGLQLSFVTVFALIKFKFDYSSIINGKYLKAMTRVLGTSILTTLVTAPFVAYHFNVVSLSGILTNIIAIPIVTHMLMPTGILYILSSFFNLEHFISKPLEFSVDMLSIVTSFFANNMSYTTILHSFPGIYLLPLIPAIKFINPKNIKELIALLSLLLCAVTGFYFNEMPDILVNAQEVGFKSPEGSLYFPQNHRRHSVASIWSKQNSEQKPAFLPKINNICIMNVCLYKNHNIEVYVFHNKLKNKEILVFKDNHIVNHLYVKNGTYSLWVNKNNIKVKLSIKNRPWYNTDRSTTIKAAFSPYINGREKPYPFKKHKTKVNQQIKGPQQSINIHQQPELPLAK